MGSNRKNKFHSKPVKDCDVSAFVPASKQPKQKWMPQRTLLILGPSLLQHSPTLLLLSLSNQLPHRIQETCPSLFPVTSQAAVQVSSRAGQQQLGKPPPWTPPWGWAWPGCGPSSVRPDSAVLVMEAGTSMSLAKGTRLGWKMGLCHSCGFPHRAPHLHEPWVRPSLMSAEPKGYLRADFQLGPSTPRFPRRITLLNTTKAEATIFYIEVLFLLWLFCPGGGTACTQSEAATLPANDCAIVVQAIS